MTPYDQQLISQLPVVILFMIFFFKINKEHKDYMTDRDKIMRESLTVLANSITTQTDKFYSLALAFMETEGKKTGHGVMGD